MEKRDFPAEDLPLETKLKAIENSACLEELNVGILPPVPLVKPDLYYFVSYSHADYKKVYADIFALQARGVNVWYDRGMRAGADWREIAEEFIAPVKCAGVIFYVSENSLASDSIHAEIEFAAACGKSCITINLPVENELYSGGKCVKDEIFSAKKLLEILRENGREISDEKYATVSEFFGDGVIFVKWSESADNKAEKIRRMTPPPLFEAEYRHNTPSKKFILTAINDRDVKRVKISDYARVHINDEEARDNYSVHGRIALSECVFANCRRLEEIELSDGFLSIPEYAFYNCTALKKINLSNTDGIMPHSFGGCTSLEKVDLSEAWYIGENAFCGCTALKSVSFGKPLREIGEKAFGGCAELSGEICFTSVKNIGSRAFEGCKKLKSVRLVGDCEIGDYVFHDCICLENAVLPDNLSRIPEGTFNNCKSFKQFVTPDKVEVIEKSAFAGCIKLEKIYIPETTAVIGRDAFLNCYNLRDIEYGGTKARWNEINGNLTDREEYMALRRSGDIFRYMGLDYDVITVHCKDGELTSVNTRLSEIEKKLASLNVRGMKFGTRKTREILDELGSPDDKLKIIHVAGTNGKGSTAAYIGNIISSHGKKTGIYLSPAVYDMREQYVIDREFSGDRAISGSFAAVFATQAAKDATRFEIETAAAINLFAQAGCEYAVLECGMGGLNDATNAVNKKELAVITSISLEHTKFLGDTLEKICEQKAGIIKNCPVVVSNLQPPEVTVYFKKLNAVFPEKVKVLHADLGAIEYNGQKYAIGMKGAVQAYNAALAIKAAELLGFTDMRAISQALGYSELSGRLEVHNTQSYGFIYLDGAHNPASIEELCGYIKDMQPTVIYGCLSDKDIDGCVKHIAGIAERLIAVQPNSPRAMDIEKIYSTCKKYFKHAERAESVSDALEKAGDMAPVVVCGSFTLLKEAKQWIEKR